MTALMRFDPVWEMERFEGLFDRMVDDLLAPTPLTRAWDPWFTPRLWAQTPDLSTLLARPIRVQDEGDVVRVQLPASGVRPDEITVEEQNGWLTIRAERRLDASWDRPGWRVWERRAGLWAHTVRLPDQVQADRAEARIENGVLTITLPKEKGGFSWLGRVKEAVSRLPVPRVTPKPKRLPVRVRRA